VIAMPMSRVVGRFAEQAARILEAAEAAADAGQQTAMTVLLGPAGISLIADSDWALDSLREHHAAVEAYRVTHSGGEIRVEGSDGQRRCRLTAENSVRRMRLLLDSPVRYALVPQHF
jgi:hypothetical protein